MTQALFDCVVAADLDDGIGKDNDLPWPRLKGDLKHFRELTSTAADGKRNAIVMGRKTWDSVPAAQRPLPKRLNVVVSRGQIALAGDALLAHSLDDALIKATAAEGIDQIFVIGGAEIYRQAFVHPRCRDVVLTRIEGRYLADAHIPRLDGDFDRIDVGPAREDNGVTYRVERWRKRPAT